MEAFGVSSDRGVHVTIESCPERPAMLPTSLQFGSLGDEKSDMQGA
jgi:hypothetical protein